MAKERRGRTSAVSIVYAVLFEHYAPTLNSSIISGAVDMARNYTAHPARFQCLSVMFPSVKESLGSLSNLLTTRELDRMYSKAVAISSIPSSPPEILLTFQTGSTFFAVNQSLLPSQRGDTTTMVNSLYLSTVIRPGRRALLDIGAKDNNVTQSETMQDFSRVWCAGGQASQYMPCQSSCLNYY